MNRIVVLGSTGFLGTELRKKLSEEKFTAKYMIHKKNQKLKNHEFFGNILDKKNISKHVKNGDIIVNLVGQIDSDVSKFFNTNINGAFNLLEAIKDKRNIKIIFASSINVYGENCKHASKETDDLRPKTNYGIVKLLTEEIYKYYSNLYNIDITILRFSNLYGKQKKTGIISNLLNSTQKNQVVLTHSGNQKRDFLFVNDAVNAIMHTIKSKPKNFQIFNISSKEKIPLKYIMKLIEKNTDRKIFYALTKTSKDEKCLWADNSKAKKILKFYPEMTLQNYFLTI